MRIHGALMAAVGALAMIAGMFSDGVGGETTGRTRSAIESACRPWQRGRHCFQVVPQPCPSI